MKTRPMYLLTACVLLFASACKKNENYSKSNSSTNLNSLKKANADEVTGTIATGAYKLVTYTTYATVPPTNKTMGVVSPAGTDAQIEQRDFFPNTTQEWRITSLGNNEYSIINIKTNQALTVLYGQAVEDRLLIQHPYSSTDNAQRWYFEQQGIYPVYRIKSKLNQAMGVHVENGSTSNGARLRLKTFTGTAPIQGAGYFLIYRVGYLDQTVTNFFKRTSGVTATDGAASILLSNGKVMWNSGDGHMNDYSNGTINCLFNKRSTTMLQPSVSNWDWTQTLSYPTGAGNMFNAPGASFTWPMASVELGGTVYVYNLTNNGTAWTTPVFAQVNPNTMAVSSTYIPISPSLNGIVFGHAFIKEADGYVYCFGAKPVPPYNIGHTIHLARFPQSNPSAAWTFYKGGGVANAANWVSNSALAVSLGDANSHSVSFAKVNGKYVMVCSQFNLECSTNANELYASVATSLGGTFSAQKLIYTIPDRINGYYPFWYGALIHPHFNANNELMVIYSINGYEKMQPEPPAPPIPPCVVTCINNRKDPDITYRPRGVRIPYKLIDINL